MNDTLHITHTQIVGSPIDTVWAKVATLGPRDMNVDNVLGQLVVVLQISRNDNEDAAFFGKSLLDVLQNTYYAKQSEKIFTAFTKALQAAYELVHRENDRIGPITLLACVTHEEVVYLGKIGQGSAMLFRESTPYALLGQSQLLQTVSGVLQPNDYIILGTNSFFEHAYPTTEVFNGKLSAQDIGDILSPLLLSLPQNADIAGYIMACEVLQKEEEPVITAPPPMSVPAQDPQPAHTMPIYAFSQPLQTQQATVQPLAASQPIHPLEQVQAPYQPAASVASRKAKILVNATQFAHRARPILYAIPKVKNIRQGMGASAFQAHKAKILRILVIGGIIIFLIAAVLGVRQFLVSRNKSQAQALYQLASANIQSAQIVKNQDTKKAEQLIEDAKNAIAEAKKKDKRIQPPAGLEASIEGTLQEVFAITAIENPDTIFDISFVKDNGNATKFDAAADLLLVVDAKTPTLFKVNLERKSGAVVAGGSRLPGFNAATILDNQAIAVTQDGILVISNEETGETKKIVEKDSIWGTIADATHFADNLYLLDSGKGQIWKYTSTGTGFGHIKNVLSQEDTAALVGANDFVIDGTFWVTVNNTIVNISNGKPTTISFDTIDKPLGNSLHIATTKDEKNIYVLDASNQRVVVISKEGRYLRQYKSQTFANVLDILEPEGGQKLYLLTATKVLQIPISQ